MKKKLFKRVTVSVMALSMVAGTLAMNASGSNSGLIKPTLVNAKLKLSGDEAKQTMDERDQYNGEKVLTIYDKPNLITNIYENEQKFTILEIVPYEWASTYQLNANPTSTISYFDDLFDSGEGFNCFGEQNSTQTPLVNQYNSGIQVKLYNSKDEVLWEKSNVDYNSSTFYYEANSIGNAIYDKFDTKDTVTIYVDGEEYTGSDYTIQKVNKLTANGKNYYQTVNEWYTSKGGPGSFVEDSTATITKYYINGTLYTGTGTVVTSIEDVPYINNKRVTGKYTIDADGTLTTYDSDGNALKTYASGKYTTKSENVYTIDGVEYSESEVTVDSKPAVKVYDNDWTGYYVDDYKVEYNTYALKDSSGNYYQGDYEVSISKTFVGDSVEYKDWDYYTETFITGLSTASGTRCYDPEHPVEVTIKHYKDGTVEYGGTKVKNYFMQQLMGDLDDKTSIYYNFRQYFEENTEVITVRACDLDESVLYREDPVDLIYIGGTIIDESGSSARQIMRNLMIFDHGTSYTDMSQGLYTNYKTGVYSDAEGTHEYTFDELLNNNVWYNSYTYKDGEYVSNDLNWEQVEMICNYCYGVGIYNTNSYITYEDGDTAYQKIPTFIEQGQRDKYPDYNVSKLQYLLFKMTDEVGTMDFPDYNCFNTQGYNENCENGMYLQHKTSFNADTSHASDYRLYFSGYQERYLSADNEASTYSGFMSNYLTEYKDDGTKYYNSAGVTTAVVKGTSYTNWLDADSSMYAIIGYDSGQVSLTNTSLMIWQGSAVSYYCFNVDSGANIKDYGTRKYARLRQIEGEEGYISVALLIQYFIGLDETDVLSAPVVAFVDNDYVDVEKTAASAYAIYCDTLDGDTIDVKLDDDNNLVITYTAYDKQGKLVSAELYYQTKSLLDVSYSTDDITAASVIDADGGQTATFTYKIPYSDDKDSLYYKFVYGSAPIYWKATNHLTIERRDNTTYEKEFSSITRLYLVGRRIFDYD